MLNPRKDDKGDPSRDGFNVLGAQNGKAFSILEPVAVINAINDSCIPLSEILLGTLFSKVVVQPPNT